MNDQALIGVGIMFVGLALVLLFIEEFNRRRGR